MYLPKSDIYNNLKELGYFVSQSQPSNFTELPAIIFSISNNSIGTDLDNNIIEQEIDVGIDIWAMDSVSASNVLSQVEEVMRNDFYNMSRSADVPNSGNLYHINSKFTKRR